MNHPEYPEVPETLLALARIIRPADWNEKLWVAYPDKWQKSDGNRTWSIGVARGVLLFLSRPSERMIAAGARELLKLGYETDTPLQDVKQVFKAMIRECFNTKAPTDEPPQIVGSDL